MLASAAIDCALSCWKRGRQEGGELGQFAYATSVLGASHVAKLIMMASLQALPIALKVLISCSAAPVAKLI